MAIELEPGDIDVDAAPSGSGCRECEQTGGWWVHLRRWAACGHIGCCDTSPAQHASAHVASSGHPVTQSFEPGEDWFYDFRSEAMFDGPRLADPQSRPDEQSVPGPAARVPANWRDLIHR